MKPLIPAFVLMIVFLGSVFAQVKDDTTRSSNSFEKKSNIPSTIEKRFEPKSSFKLFKDDFTLPHNLKKYTAIMSLDFQPPIEHSKEEANSGLSEKEIESFRSNKNSTMKMLSDFYGDDLVDIQKLLDSVGLTKDQIVGILMALKFVFGQALIK